MQGLAAQITDTMTWESFFTLIEPLSEDLRNRLLEAMGLSQDMPRKVSGSMAISNRKDARKFLQGLDAAASLAGRADREEFSRNASSAVIQPDELAEERTPTQASRDAAKPPEAPIERCAPHADPRTSTAELHAAPATRRKPKKARNAAKTEHAGAEESLVVRSNFDEEAALEEVNGLLGGLGRNNLRIGTILLTAKEALPHGRFTKWMAKATGLSRSFGTKAMQVARMVADRKCVDSHRLPWEALCLLARAKVPEELREELLINLLGEHPLPLKEVRARLKSASKDETDSSAPSGDDQAEVGQLDELLANRLGDDYGRALELAHRLGPAKVARHLAARYRERAGGQVEPGTAVTRPANMATAAAVYRAPLPLAPERHPAPGTSIGVPLLS